MRLWRVTITKLKPDSEETTTMIATLYSRNAQTAASVFIDLRTENHRVTRFEVEEVPPKDGD